MALDFLNVILKYLLVITVICNIVHSYSIEGHNAKWPNRHSSVQETEDSRSFDDEYETNKIGSGIMRSIMSTWNGCVDEENAVNNGTITCQGVRIVRKMLTQLLDSQKTFQISNGVQLVKVQESNAVGAGSRGLGDSNDSSFLGRVSRFLQSHELRVRLLELLPSGEDWSSYLSGALESHHGGHEATARKKNKGGGAAILAMAGMMGGMMMMMGIAGVGALAMKALAVSAIALVLAAVAALKKLASKDDDGGHHVSVVPVHHGGDYGHGHRRKRDTDEDLTYLLPYRGYYKR